MDTMKQKRLQELDRSDFQIVKGEPDIRGWDIRGSHGRKIGEVEELIIDVREKVVRYMIADLNEKEFNNRRKVLIPIGLAELDKKEDDVLLPRINKEQLNELPAYDRDQLDEGTEQRICAILGMKTSDKYVSTEADGFFFYQNDYFNTDNLYKNRLHEGQRAKASREESEYQIGLKLWEIRSETGVITDVSGSSDRDAGSKPTPSEEDIRGEKIRERRRVYEERKKTKGSPHSVHTHNLDKRSVKQRIKDEGLQDG